MAVLGPINEGLQFLIPPLVGGHSLHNFTGFECYHIAQVLIESHYKTHSIKIYNQFNLVD